MLAQLSRNWWMCALRGVVAIWFGILAFAWPSITVFMLLYLIAAWSIVTRIFEIPAAIKIRKEITNEWLFVLSGMLSVVFGVLIAPFPGVFSIIWLLATYAILFGILLIMLGLRVRGWSAIRNVAT